MTEERRLAAIMFCDVCGFSRIMGDDESRALAVADMAIGCIESAAALYGGRIIKKLGDGALCEFSSAVNAVRCAIEIQKAVATHDATAEAAQQFQMRIGLHVGDVVVSDGDILGDGVNVASRIEPLAEPGGICISRDVFDMVKNKVSIETINLGPHDLKNISRQIDIYKVIIDAVSGGRLAAPVSAKGLRHRFGRASWWIAGIVAVVLAMAGLVTVLKGVKARQARRQFAALNEESRALAEAGKFEDAIERLKRYPARFADSPWQAKVDEAVVALETRAVRETVMERQRSFYRAVADDDKSEALRMLEPEALDEGEGPALWLRLRMASGMLKAVSAGPDSFKIETVDVAADRQSARIWSQVRIVTPAKPEGTWEDMPPAEWRYRDGDWRLHVPPRKGIESKAGRESGRRPALPRFRP